MKLGFVVCLNVHTYIMKKTQVQKYINVNVFSYFKYNFNSEHEHNVILSPIHLFKHAQICHITDELAERMA